ncbi:unnamed protein product [Paramecium pentaurelia]|uniref:Uncharacterized protein n=1 Tax=Paramecium pentaurelia TaxID=43138 RepID=A0A8S1TFA6_9CILI|nr:unnamed protein product [Paramecium pentaurelia]CAD8151887.1 unnamed protein product [Paramecium pentaurelia]
MNNLVGGSQKYKGSQMNSDLPIIQNRKQIRAVSLQQIFFKAKSNSQQVEINNNNNKYLHTISSKNLNYDNHPQTERQDTKLRSQSMINRLQRQKESETMLTQIDSNKKGIKKQITHVINNSDIKIPLQRVNLKKIEYNQQFNNEVINSILQMKLNKQSESDQQNNNLIHSTNNLLNQINERPNMNKIRQVKQNDNVKSDGQLLSFRQFAKLQGFNLPSFLKM